MIIDPNSALRAELKLALDILNPQIRGLQDLALTPGSAALKNQIKEQSVICLKRLTLINAVLDATDLVASSIAALELDGYPDLIHISLEPSTFNELQKELHDLLEASKILEAILTSGQTAGDPASVKTYPQPVPPIP